MRKAQLTRSRTAWEFAKLPFRFAKPRFLRLGGRGDTAHRDFGLVTTSKLRKAQLTRSRSAWEFAKLPFRFAKPRFLRLGGKGDTAHRDFGPWPDGTEKKPIRLPFADRGFKGGCRPAQVRGEPRKVLCPAFCERKLARCGAKLHGLSPQIPALSCISP